MSNSAGTAGSGTSRPSNNYAVDTRPPVLDTAAVNGSQLVLTYTEGSSLNDSHKAAASAFAVMVNGTANAVTGVAVNGTAKTVTLTLTSAVTAGQTVTVGYTDPTAGDDDNAVQDGAGNDAASLEAHAVTNNTGGASSPPPSPSPSGSTGPTISSIVVDKTSLRTGQTATVTFTFSEAVSGFTAEDALGKGGVLSNPVTSDNGITWTAMLTPLPTWRTQATRSPSTSRA